MSTDLEDRDDWYWWCQEETEVEKGQEEENTLRHYLILFLNCLQFN
jgi:hypothetical protein